MLFEFDWVQIFDWTSIDYVFRLYSFQALLRAELYDTCATFFLWWCSALEILSQLSNLEQILFFINISTELSLWTVRCPILHDVQISGSQLSRNYCTWLFILRKLRFIALLQYPWRGRLIPGTRGEVEDFQVERLKGEGGGGGGAWSRPKYVRAVVNGKKPPCTCFIYEYTELPQYARASSSAQSHLAHTKSYHFKTKNKTV